MFREQGIEVLPQDFVPFVGTGEDRYLGGVAEKYGVVLNLVTAKRRTYEIYLKLVPEQLEVFPGATSLVAECVGRGLKIAVASSADLIKIEANLNKIGLPIKTWDAVVTAEDVVRKKPAPDIFLTAATKLGVEARGVCGNRGCGKWHSGSKSRGHALRCGGANVPGGAVASGGPGAEKHCTDKNDGPHRTRELVANKWLARARL